MTNIIKYILLFLLITPFSYATGSNREMIIDTDVGIDDVIAILYVFKHPEINVKAITIASDGNAHCEPALKNMLGILSLSHHTGIPIACGRKTPLQGNHHFPDFVLTESDTLGGTANSLPKVPFPPQSNAKELLIKTLSESKREMDILAIGPLTNIAEAIKSNPELKHKIRMIYIMGGAIHVPGNIIEIDPTIKNYVAEWNIYLDPTAADIVFRSGIPITLISLDSTNQVPLNKQFFKDFSRTNKDPISNYVFEMLQSLKPAIDKNIWYFWDELAAVISVNEPCAKFKTEKLSVLLTPESKSGATIIDNENGTPVRIVDTVDKQCFTRLFLKAFSE